jgi:hypothetical protein
MKNEIMLAYMAGFFDGEGSINIIKRNRGNWTPEYTLSVAMGQKDGKTLDWVKDNFGGNVYVIKRDGSFFWLCGNVKAITFLKQLLPYLQYKKSQAELAIKFHEEREPRTIPVSQSELARRERIRQDLVSLHKFIIKSQYAGSTTKRVNPKGM